MLDERQKEALTMALDYAKKLTTFPLSSKRQHLPVPTAPLVIVHGGAGSGKSRLISSIYNMVTDTLKKPGDNPDCPYILLTSFTGAQHQATLAGRPCTRRSLSSSAPPT